MKDYLRSNDMFVRGRNVPNPCFAFEEANFPGKDELDLIESTYDRYSCCFVCVQNMSTLCSESWGLSSLLQFKHKYVWPSSL